MHFSPSKEGQCHASDEQQVALVEAESTFDGSGLATRDAVPESAATAAAHISFGYEMSAQSANSNNNSNQQVKKSPSTKILKP